MTLQLHEHVPHLCSNCYQQLPESRYVEFDAAFDGPTLNAAEVIQNGAEPVAIDDLILCEVCLTAAAKLIGLVRAPDLVIERDNANGRREQVEEENIRLRKTVKDLLSAIREATPGETRLTHRAAELVEA